MEDLKPQKLSILQRIHRSEHGAVALMMLAGSLILMMVAFTLYDAGGAAADKMAVQVSADSAAYSHSVVKARTMNVVVFANIIKRFYYSYLSTYTNAWAAILWAEAQAISGCGPWPWQWCNCAEAVEMGIFILIEGIEAFITNEPTLGIFFGNNDYVPLELNALENYQQYMTAITPWWAYVEGFSRAAINGGMISAQWPPPPTAINNIKSAIGGIGAAIQLITGTNVLNMLPGFSNNVDALPIARRDRMRAWATKTDPFNFSFEQGTMLAGAKYCLAYIGSFEHIIHGFQTWRNGDEGWLSCPNWRPRFLILDVVPAIGCITAHLVYQNDGYLDWRIHSQMSEPIIGAGGASEKENWNQATGVVAMAYRPREGRNSATEERQKYNIINKDHDRKSIYTNEGYFAMARSEIVYKQPFNALAGWNVPGIFSAVTSRLGVNDEPDMWSPRWKGRNRPFSLRDEKIGSAIDGNNVGMNTLINDMIPLMLLGATIGIFDPNFGFGSAWGDLQYIFRVGTTFQQAQLNGVAK